ncbi:MAG TPA: FKBP-type peptidyl-prolyl cis-trans isomerase [Polyangia bacterium]|jgi:FKBP-type peptidyl-prolyl cis-trans isomerase SlyD|nr:FKBP-type peptidyl-prolyl cis-trans isomerase [Polyangia bacterium]
MKIAAGLSVQIDYELSVKGGDVIESSARGGPLRYVHGQGKMLPGLESRLLGLSPGDEKRGEIPARDAFGAEDAQPIKEMARKDFPKDAKLEAGSVFEAKSPTGEPLRLKIVSASADQVKARLLHPLVGRDLVFRVKVLAVSDPHRPPPAPGIVELDVDDLKDDLKDA